MARARKERAAGCWRSLCVGRKWVNGEVKREGGGAAAVVVEVVDGVAGEGVGAEEEAGAAVAERGRTGVGADCAGVGRAPESVTAVDKGCKVVGWLGGVRSVGCEWMRPGETSLRFSDANGCERSKRS